MTDIRISSSSMADVGVLSSTGRRLFVQAYGEISGAEDLAAHVDEYFSEQAVANEIGKKDVQYFLASDGDDVAGFLKIRRGEIPDAVPASAATEVQQLYVDAVHQRKGIGRLLMDHAITVAKQKSDDGVWLSVWQDADWAISFYEAYGFWIVGTTDFRLGGSSYTDYLMWLPTDS